MQANILSDLFNIISNYLNEISYAEKISLLLIIAAAILFMILERLFPYTKGQKLFREGFFDDFALYTIAQSYILSILIFSGIIRFVDNTTGIIKTKTICRCSDLDATCFFYCYT